MLLKKNAHFVIYILFTPVILFILLQLYIYFYFNNTLEKYLESQVSKASHGEYILSLNGVSISIISQSVSLKTVQLLHIEICNICEKVKYDLIEKEIKSISRKVV